MNRLADKNVIITGAASGIGQATAKLFAAEGAKVMVADFNEAGGAQTVQQIRETGGTAEFSKTDVTKAEDFDRTVKSLVELWGRLDVMVNNAGILDGMMPIVTTDEELYDRIMAVNVKGVFLGMKRAVEQFNAQGTGGVIINTASIAGLGAMAGGTAYTASKHAVVGLTKQVACEVATNGIRVNAVCPGAVSTPMVHSLVGGTDIEQASSMFGTYIPMKRVAEPEEIAQGFLFLASDESSYMTGSLLTIDGGWRAK